jgi:hypothetical protein
VDLTEIIERQKKFSEKTFGPGKLTANLCAHIKSEIEEIEDAPWDVYEWVDVIILALDGAWRNGFTPEQIVQAIEVKQTVNESREWRTIENGKPFERIKDDDSLR